MVPTSSPLSAATWSKFAAFQNEHTLPDGIVFHQWEIDAFGGSFEGTPTAINALPGDVNAFGPRDGLLMMHLCVVFSFDMQERMQG